MRRRLLLASLPLALFAGRASAQVGAGQYVDLAPVAVPVVVGGRLVNYVFVYVRIDLTGDADTPHWRDKEPYFRDALVKLVGITSFTAPGSDSRLDQPRLKAAMLRAAVAITGPGVVTGVELLPGGGPMRRLGFHR